MSENKYPIGGYAPDTDARSQAPTFDEMVAMIEKLFKDYLKDIRKNALTDEQIEEGWQRYNTLNHLYQDEQPKPAGAVWVKASEFKYQLETDYFYKFEYLGEKRKGIGEFNSDGLFVLSHGPMLPPVSIDRVYILDESGTAAVQYESVFAPCAEDDPNVSGGYTSNDGRSLCYVKEVLATIKK